MLLTILTRGISAVGIGVLLGVLPDVLRWGVRAVRRIRMSRTKHKFKPNGGTKWQYQFSKP